MSAPSTTDAVVAVDSLDRQAAPTLVRCVLDALARDLPFPDRLPRVLEYLRDAIGCEAVGVRLRHGNDFPYLAAVGFSETHIQLENRLRASKPGPTTPGASRAPVLECICGRVLSGDLAAASRFRTPGGGLALNSAADIRAVAAECALWAQGQCCAEGRQSMALLPLRSGQETVGLLQMNDRRPNLFGPATLARIEDVAAVLSLSVGGWLTAQRLERQLAYAELLDEVVRDMAAARDLDTTLEISLTHLEERLGTDVAAVWVADEAGAGVALLRHSEQVAAAAGAAELEHIPGLAPLVSGVDTPLYVTDVDHATPDALTRVLAGLNLGSAVVAPLRIEHRVAGILLVGRREPNGFEPEEIAFLRQAAEHLGLAACQMRLHQELSNACDGLRQSRDAVMQQERLRALGQMASGVAHDFNNTLAPILGFSDLLLMRPEMLADRTRAKQYIEMINTAARDAGKVVSRLREFYRSRDMNEAVAPILINRVVEQVVSLTQPKWKDQVQINGVLIDIQRDLRDVPVLYGNEAELREALINLVFNAVDALPAGGTITLRTHSARHTPEPEAEPTAPGALPLAAGNYAVIDVIDTGTGMTPEVRQRCMEPFFSTKGNCGTGMGLATVYGAVRRHNGAVHIDSAIGTGTTVSLWLPVEDAHELTKTRKRDPNLDTTVLSGLHVLVVEDDPRVREVLLAFLTGEGHIVDVAASGKEGLFKFKRGGFGLVITDRSMSGGGGDQLAAAVKQVSPSVPVIMLTGFSEFMKAGGERPPGVDVLVGKPISMAELRQAVGEAMGRNG